MIAMMLMLNDDSEYQRDVMKTTADWGLMLESFLTFGCSPPELLQSSLRMFQSPQVISFVQMGCTCASISIMANP